MRTGKVLENRLRDWAAARGYGLTIAGTGVIEAVRKKLKEREDAGMIDPGFYRENLGSFRYLDGSAIAGPKCIVMVAVPSPIHVLPLTVGGRKIDALIPPTYVRYNKTFVDVLADMKGNALGNDAEAEILKAPLKSLAVHMGLVSYGRNNITYAPGLGSGHQLCGYVVGMEGKPVVAGESKGGPEAAGLPASDAMRAVMDIADWRETMLERCADCRACIKACPTGAIREDRFLISAERCFTYFSESRKSFPLWARTPRSICLIGCMACQQVCPENKGRLKTESSGVEFTAEETEAVLAAGRRLGVDGNEGGDAGEGVMCAALESARAKFDELGMSEDLELMGRNLKCFLNRR